mmetsp:Transcript_3113/g.4779  ORF Transcript_3113/g.4779 Transcript_3113/m.4779 type:complete len:283 (+) Transcript_3113:68-916(+)
MEKRSSIIPAELRRMVDLCESLQRQLVSITEDADNQQKYLCHRLSILEAENKKIKEERNYYKKECGKLKMSALGRNEVTSPEKVIEKRFSFDERKYFLPQSSTKSNSSFRTLRETSERVLKGVSSVRSVDTVAQGNDWVKESSVFPCPPYGLGNPVVKLIVSEWSSDLEKQTYLNYWLRSAASKEALPQGFPTGLQLVSIPTEIKDGFIMVVIPILIKESGRKFQVYCRKSSELPTIDVKKLLWDLRIRVKEAEYDEISTPSETAFSSGSERSLVKKFSSAF